MKENKRRLFLGMEVFAPWQLPFPQARLLDEVHRHMTLVFIGDVHFSKLENLLISFPKPSFKVGKVGFFDKTLFLPEKHPSVVSWHVNWIDDSNELLAFQKECSHWLKSQGFQVHTKEEFLPHVTLCRSPFDQKKWEQAFTKIPVIVKDIHLYESLGDLKYVPVWTHRLKSPFEEMSHTADLGFKILSENILELFHHAEAALAFKFPAILNFLSDEKKFNGVEDMIIALNQLISRVDSEIGCPFKAISFHGSIKEVNQILEWEMIVDV